MKQCSPFTLFFALFAACCSLLSVVVHAQEKDGRPVVQREEAALIDAALALADAQPQQARLVLQEAVDAGKAGPAARFALANLLLRADEVTAAEQLLRSVIEMAPDYLDALRAWGSTLARLERWAEAEAVIQPLVSRADADADLHLLLGYVLVRQDRIVSAEGAYRAALLRGANRLECLHGLARCFSAQGRHAESAALLRELVAARPTEVIYWSMLAEGELAQNNSAAAAAYLEAARRLKLADASMLLRLGELHLYTGWPQGAVDAVNHALMMSKTPSILLRAAVVCEAAGSLDQARVILAQFLAQDASALGASEHLSALRIQARLSLSEPEQTNALLAHQKWVEADPMNVTALLAMGDLLATKQGVDAAAIWYQRARRADPRHPEPLLRLARQAVALPDYSEALRLTRQAFQLSGDRRLEETIEQLQRLSRLDDASP